MYLNTKTQKLTNTKLRTWFLLKTKFKKTIAFLSNIYYDGNGIRDYAHSLRNKM